MTSTRPKPSPAFVTTRWTRVVAAKQGDTDAKTALAELCETYYQPVVTFLRCRGNDEDRARELAHEFFAQLLGRGSLGNVEKGRGKFRSYLLAAVKHFVADQFDKSHAAKRGGGREHVELKPATDTSPGIDPADPDTISPEAEFDRQWALTLLQDAMESLAAEQEAAGKTEQFTALKPWLTGGSDSQSQKDAADELGMNEGALKVAIHRLRKRYRALVKEAVGQTLPNDERVEDELSYLISVMG
ncbi:MAG: RNA polymerase sigma factor [Limisphaerales bacterium]